MSSAQAQADFRVKDSYIVLLDPRAGPPERVADSVARTHGISVRHVYAHAIRGMAISVPAPAAGRVLSALRRNPAVLSIGNDMLGLGFAEVLPKGVDRVEADPGLRPNSGDGVRIAVVDSGLDFLHADLAQAIDTSISVDCVSVSGCTAGGRDDNKHGTFVGGVISALDNDGDVIGVAPSATLFSVKVLKADNTGSASDFLAGMDHIASLNAAGVNVDVANMSLGFVCSSCTDDSTNSTVVAIHDAIRALVDGGTTVVVAAGNAGEDASTTIPAAFDEVITVSALKDGDGQPGGDSFASFSNYGEDIDLTGPGVGELSLRLGGGTRTGSGTSFASPHVAGVAALFIRDHLDKTGFRPSPATVRRALIETGECADGTIHDGLGCDLVWSGDPDGLAEPLVRADRIAGFSTVLADMAVTTLSVSAPVIVGKTHAVTVAIANEGGTTETVAVTLDDDGFEIGFAADVPLAPGESTSLVFDWIPASVGSHTLLAGVDIVPGEEDTADNSRSTVVEVQEEAVRDVAVADVRPPSNLVAGETGTVAVEVASRGTTDEEVVVSLAAGAVDGGGSGTLSDPQSVFLAAGSSAVVDFTWDTTGAASGDHELAASVALSEGTDANEADNSLTATTTLAAAAEVTLPALYTGDMTLGVRRRGKGGSMTDLQATVLARIDSDGDLVAESSDDVAKNASVALIVVRNANGDGMFDCGAEPCWTLQASTNGKGEVSFSLSDMAAGLYRVAVASITLDGATHEPALDRNTPQTIELR